MGAIPRALSAAKNRPTLMHRRELFYARPIPRLFWAWERQPRHKLYSLLSSSESELRSI